jgi:hypothetical protein
MAAPSHFHAAIIGAGPAGTGPLVYGAWSGRLGELLDRGVAVIERGSSIGPGRLERYVINSNSTGATFLECLEHGVSDAWLTTAANSAARAQVLPHRDSVLPLSTASALLRDIGTDLRRACESSGSSQVLLDTQAVSVKILSQSTFEIELRGAAGAPASITANRVLFATGGEAQVARGAGSLLMQSCRDHGVDALPMMITSEELLTESGRTGAERWLEAYDSPRIVVVGGAHSAMSSVWLLLERMAVAERLAPGAITLLHRSPLAVFYESASEARADGFDAFTAADVGAKGQVFPIAGLRGDAKQLYRRIVGLDAAREPRVRLLPLPSDAAGCAALPIDWRELALVVFANGYSLPQVPLRTRKGSAVPLYGHFTERYVDQRSRLLDAFGAPLPGLFATGFTSGFSPVEMLGGERSYRGKENSVWLCQHMLGESLFNSLLAN